MENNLLDTKSWCRRRTSAHLPVRLQEKAEIAAEQKNWTEEGSIAFAQCIDAILGDNKPSVWNPV